MLRKSCGLPLNGSIEHTELSVNLQEYTGALVGWKRLQVLQLMSLEKEKLPMGMEEYREMGFLEEQDDPLRKGKYMCFVRSC